jgi:Na+-transporting methylmalonyl-CoA/oxaloacetate decarboxylase gamma subunit
MTVLSKALIMTALGMGLVFIGIVLLWGFMALMVRLFPNKEEKEVKGETNDSATGDDAGLKQKAAAAAVAVAMALNRGAYSITNEVSGATMSSWQSVTRAMQLNLRNQTFSRKTRGYGR